MIKHYDGYVIVKTLHNKFNLYTKEGWEKCEKPIEKLNTIVDCIDYIQERIKFLWVTKGNECPHDNRINVQISLTNEQITVCLDCGVEL